VFDDSCVVLHRSREVCPAPPRSRQMTTHSFRSGKVSVKSSIEARSDCIAAAANRNRRVVVLL